MGHTFTLDLPPNLAKRAQTVAEQSHRPIEEVLLEWLGRAASEVPLESLPDYEIMALSELEMPKDQQRELTKLLARQREGELGGTDHARLSHLMDVYRRGMVQRAQALKIAVERGLRSPLDETRGA